ncbi:MAG: hypothetical protein PHO73_05155 [Atribacterota bacterium]|nr:hypothetical protein [Atribacterota bacterium]
MRLPRRFAPRNDIQNAKIKSVGRSGCDCHDLLSANLAMTEGQAKCSE